MKKYKILIMLITMSFILIACGSTDDNEKKSYLNNDQYEWSEFDVSMQLIEGWEEKRNRTEGNSTVFEKENTTVNLALINNHITIDDYLEQSKNIYSLLEETKRQGGIVYYQTNERENYVVKTYVHHPADGKTVLITTVSKENNQTNEALFEEFLMIYRGEIKEETSN